MKLKGYRQKIATRFAGQRLFLKVFLWFWLTASGLLVVLVLGYSFSFSFNGVQVIKSPNLNLTVASILTPEAVRAYESAGPAGFAHFEQSSADANERNLFLLDGNYHDVLSRAVTKDGLRLAHLTHEDQLSVFRSRIAAYRYVSPETGRPYTMLLYVQSEPGGLDDLLQQEGIAFLIGVLLLVTLLCFWLAHHIAAPIRDIQVLARKVAEGDLQARASTSLLERHDEIAPLAADFNDMVGRIQALVHTHKNLLAAVSHEVRSPLTRLGVAVALLRRAGGGAGQPLLDRIDREIVNMDELMGQLLTLARLESSLQPSTAETIDLASLLEEIADDANFELEQAAKAVCLTVECRPTLQYAYGIALRSALENVVRNAGRFAPESTEVRIVLSCSGSGAAAEAVIQVIDSGPGVAPEHLREIFLPFVRLISGATQIENLQHDGNGLGLAIAAEAVRLHGGSIVARDGDQGGLTIEFRIPLDRLPTLSDEGVRPAYQMFAASIPS